MREIPADVATLKATLKPVADVVGYCPMGCGRACCRECTHG